jgi:cobalt-zinc-cadmium efflux system outer membrane protein
MARERAPAQTTSTPVPVAASPAPITLGQLEQLADAYNPILTRDRALIEAAKGTAIQAGLMPNPSFNSGNPLLFAGRNSLPNFGFQQEIPVMGKLRLDRAVADQTTRQAEQAAWQNRAAMKTAIRQQYYSVLALQTRIVWYDRFIGAFEQLHRAGRDALGSGKDANQADVQAILIDWQRTQAQRRALAARLQINRRELAFTVGRPELSIGDLAGTLDGPYPRFDENAILEHVAQRSSAVRIAESVLTQSRIQSERARVSWVPNPTLGPGFQDGVDPVPGSNQFWINLTFTIPAWHQNQGAVYAARANVASAQESLRATQNQLQAKLLDQLSLYQAALEKVLAHDQVVLPTARQAVADALQAVRKDVKTLPSHAQVVRLWLQTENEFIDGQLELWNAAIELAGQLQIEAFPLNLPDTPDRSRQ